MAICAATRLAARAFLPNLVAPIENAGFEVDIFMHSWDFVDGTKVSWSYEKDIAEDIKPAKTPSKEYLMRLYKLKAVAITPQPKHKDSEKFVKCRYEFDYKFGSILGAYCSIHSVNSLRREYEKQVGVEYNLVLVTRTDLFFNQPFSLDFLGKNTKDKIFGYYAIMECEQAGLDQLYLAHPSVINAIAALYESLDYEALNKANLYNPEGVMQNFLVANKIELLALNTRDRPWEILRTNDYKIFRGWIEAPPTVCISENEYKRLKNLERFNGFVKFYTRKQLLIKPKNFFTKIRLKTRPFRYAIKRFFGWKKDKSY